ncbi:unnamed protein product [Meloidogyne enterolobii]|uniref:Uncharacterized protein n=1 Tax=Meloidogyne enterolobii TaxID=390850 RepID=A0ACB0XNQ7_MELEN
MVPLDTAPSLFYISFYAVFFFFPLLLSTHLVNGAWVFIVSSLVFSPFWRRLVDFRRSLPLTLFTNDSLIQVLCFLLF